MTALLVRAASAAPTATESPPSIVRTANAEPRTGVGPAETAPTIALLTMGPGDHAFSKFGHIAIVVRDPVRQRDEVYNYGTFSFDSPWLIVDFLEGNLRYWLSVDTLSHTVAFYRREQRSILVQELALLPDQSRELAAFLRDNARPENRYYQYDYYRDNCSTRVRDALDRAALGRIRAASQIPGRLTFRGHTARLVAGDFPLYAALDIVMGPLIDQPITAWDETFLPEELANVIRKVEVPTPSGDVPLVSREYLLSTSDRTERNAPPKWTPRFGAAGAVAGAGVVALARSARRAARVAFAIAQAALGLVTGLLGMAFVSLWAMTPHRVAYRNENLLLCAPLALALVGLAVGVACERATTSRWAFRISLALALSATLDIALKMFPLSQANGAWIALFVPLWWSVAIGHWMALRRASLGSHRASNA